jgi:hypothetical protein
MIKYFILILILISGFASSLIAQEDNGEPEELHKFVVDKTVVPLVRVISNPEKYDGKVVKINGYYLSGTHVLALFIDKDSCLSFRSVNSINLGIELNEKDFKPCGNITVKGTIQSSR